MISDKDLIKQFEEHYSISKYGCRNQWQHIQECLAFYAGDTMNYRQSFAFGRGSSKRVREVEFNRVKPYVNSIVGFMAQQRRKPDYQARMSDAEYQKAWSDYINGLSDYIRDNTNADQMETRQDMDMMIGGIGATDTAITLTDGTPTRDPNGEILVERVDPRFVGWDPDASHPNILDSRWVYRTKDYDLNEAMKLFNAEADEFEMAGDREEVTNFEFNPYGGIQDKIGFEWSDPQRRLVRVYFYQWFEVENFYRVENPLMTITNENLSTALSRAFFLVDESPDDEMFKFDPNSPILVMTKKNRKTVKRIFESFDLTFDPVVEKRKIFYSAIKSGLKIFSKYKSASQQGFSLKFKTGDRDEVNHIWTGIVSSMRQPQRYYNKSLTELMLIIANNSRGGVIYEEGAVDNVQEFESNWALPNSAVRVNDGALSGGKIQPKATPALPTGYENILQLSGDALSQVTGIDESFFGSIGGGNETAMLQRQRIKQATTTLAVYFDSIGLYAKEQARMMLSFMRLLAESSDGKLFKMIGDDDNIIFERLSLDFFADEYETSVGESPETPVQKEYFTQTLLQMAQSMQAIGDPKYKQMYAASVKYMPFPNRDKNAIIEVLLGDEQIDPALIEQLQGRIQQLEGEQAQIMNAAMIAEIKKAGADTRQKIASANKTEAEIEGVYEDVEKKALENDLLAVQDPRDVTVNI